MPVTPLHMGPAMVVKGALGARFSLLVFGFSQVVIDLEPLVGILRDDPELHGFTHTYLGATLVALGAMFAGRPFCQWLLRRFQADPGSPPLVWLHGPDTISWGAAALSAFLGTYSHVFLDSFMHADMKPFAPWSSANPQLLAVSVDGLQLGCLLSGVAGAVLMGLVYVARARWVRRA
jgi:hypothetical protein